MRASLALVFIVLFSFSLISCREELPSEEDQQNDAPVVYSTKEFFYVGNSRADEIYKVETESNDVVDTVRGIESGIGSIATSYDGRKIYVSTWGGNPDDVHVFNIETDYKAVISYSTSHLYITPGNNILIFSFEGDSTRIGEINTQTDLITYHDTLSLRYEVFPNELIAFDPAGKYFYAVTKDSKLIKYNYSTYSVERDYNQDYSLERIIISNDGSTIYSTGGSVINVATGNVTGSIPVYDYGYIAISNDDRYLYLTDATGKNEDSQLPTAKVVVYDLQSLSIVNEISVLGFVNYLSYTNEIVLTSDGTKAYVSGAYDVFVIDLVNRQTTEVVNFTTEIRPTALCMGKWISYL